VPELPEVETVRRSLEPGLYEGVIVGFEASRLALRQRPIERNALAGFVGARFIAARRHGKYLLLDADRGKSLLVHLGMSGRLLLVDAKRETEKHTHLALTFSSGRQLRFVDPRRFGAVRVYASTALAASPELEVLGPDPLGGSFAEPTFSDRLSRTRRDLKSALLDQRLVAGLGNIYVSEVLFVARVSPLKKAHRTTKRERSAIYAAICTVLTRAVLNRGTSFSDYVDAEGRSGENQHALFVYGRAAQPCRVCKAPIRRVVQGARSSFYCPRCQRTR
jgi:formamidopyrimidine-DNA glycosylase